MGPPLYVIIPIGIFGGIITVIVFGTFFMVFSAILCPNKCSCLKRFSYYQTASVHQTTTVVTNDGSVHTHNVGYTAPNAMTNPAASYSVMHGQAGLPAASYGVMHGQAGLPAASYGVMHGQTGPSAASYGSMHGQIGLAAPYGVMSGQPGQAPMEMMGPQPVPYGVPMGTMHPPMTLDGTSVVHQPPPYRFDQNDSNSSIINTKQ